MQLLFSCLFFLFLSYWLVKITTPEPSTLVFISFRFILSLMPLNNGLPFPRITGLTISWYSSINPRFVKADYNRAAAEYHYVLWPGSCFIFKSSSFIEYFHHAKFFQFAFSSVFEKTILGALFILSAISRSLFEVDGFVAAAGQ